MVGAREERRDWPRRPLGDGVMPVVGSNGRRQRGWSAPLEPVTLVVPTEPMVEAAARLAYEVDGGRVEDWAEDPARKGYRSRARAMLVVALAASPKPRPTDELVESVMRVLAERDVASGEDRVRTVRSAIHLVQNLPDGTGESAADVQPELVEAVCQLMFRGWTTESRDNTFPRRRARRTALRLIQLVRSVPVGAEVTA